METFQFKIGAGVMFIVNQDLMDDLFNGAGGTIVGVEYNKKKELNCIIVKFDLEKCRAKQRAKCYERNEFLKKNIKQLMEHQFIELNMSINSKPIMARGCMLKQQKAN